MKKQIAFYIGWDIVFVLMLYAYTFIELGGKRLFYRMEHGTTAYLWGTTGLIMLIGVMIFLLVHISGKFCFTKKLAVCEFVIVGIPAFYIAAIMAVTYSLTHFTEEAIFCIPIWYYYSTISMVAGGILFGYEMGIFITRMIGFHRTKADLSELKDNA